MRKLFFSLLLFSHVALAGVAVNQSATSRNPSFTPQMNTATGVALTGTGFPAHTVDYAKYYKNWDGRMCLVFAIRVTGTGGNASAVQISIPTGFTINTSMIPTTTTDISSERKASYVGRGLYWDHGDGAQYQMTMHYKSSTTFQLWRAVQIENDDLFVGNANPDFLQAEQGDFCFYVNEAF